MNGILNWDDWYSVLSGSPFTLHPSLKLVVCPHFHHALLAEQKVEVAVCIRVNSQFSTHVLDVIFVVHLEFEVQIMLRPAVDHKLCHLLHSVLGLHVHDNGGLDCRGISQFLIDFLDVETGGAIF